MMRPLVFLLLLALLGGIVQEQSNRLQQRPTILKLGPVPHAGLVRATTGEHLTALSFRTVISVMFYFGSFFEKHTNRMQDAPEYLSMYNHLKHAVQLDPYNVDAYYFAEAAFTWELGRAKEVNSLLDYGMKYRTWDYQLPFFAGFNAAYFLKDYATAARYMQLAAERSNNPLFTKLAARYFHESGQSAMGLAFLDTMEKGAKSDRVRQIYHQRKEALLAVNAIESALEEFQMRYQQLPESLSELVTKGLFDEIPSDPYGGKFYLAADGKVRSSSKFVMQSLENEKKPVDTE